MEIHPQFFFGHSTNKQTDKHESKHYLASVHAAELTEQ